MAEICGQRRIAKATFSYWREHLVTTQTQAQVAKPAQRFLSVPLVAAVAERIEVDLGTMRVRLDAAGAVRIVVAIIARVGTGA